MIGRIRNAAFSTSAKWTALAVTVLCIATVCSAAHVSCAATLDISAPSAILVEAHTGKVLFEKDADTQRPPASMTKIMTLLLVMEALDRGQMSTDDVVTASENAARMGGTQIWLAAGEQMTVDDLLKSVAIASANDAAVALGEHVSGAEEVFVGLMNKRAVELGATNTVFVNPTGLLRGGGGPENLTTARDLAIMSLGLLNYPRVLDYTSIWIDQVRGGNPVLNNTNRFVRYYEGCDGLKTGYIESSKHCLTATAKRGDLRLVSVVMGAATSDARYDDTRKLLDYGFANYQAVPIAKAGQVLGAAPVSKGELETVPVSPRSDFAIVLQKSESRDVQQELVWTERLTAPIAEGQVVGSLVVSKDGQVLGSVDLVATEAVKRGHPVKLFFRSVRKLFGMVFR